MITNFKIDQTATFQNGVVYLACEPMVDRETGRQAMTKGNKAYKWQVHTLVGMRNQFGQLGFETFKVGVQSETPADPCEHLQPQEPVELVGFEVGVMERTKRDPNTGEERVIGVTVWYRASEIRSTRVTGQKAA